MSREIKFRVWDKLEKRFDKNHHLTMDLNGRIYNLQNGAGGEDYEIQQFTGLTDVSNKEIYEGDIILFNDERLLIEWNSESAAFVGIIYLEHDGDQWREPDFDAARSLDEFCGDEEVIGNIFENPTLL